MNGHWQSTCLVLLLALALGPHLQFTFAAGSQEQQFTITVQHRQVPRKQRVIRVRQGQRVWIRWISDETITLHLHGYDLEKTVKPGVPTIMRFTAYATGRFPISAHGFGTRVHSKREIPLVYVEVLPR